MVSSASKNIIPVHIAIIMDGNGRWAQRKGLPRTVGHRQGIIRVKEIIRAANDRGIKVLTLFAFSAENWSRPQKEVTMLMRALGNFLAREVEELHKKNIRLKVIGRSNPVPEYILDKLAKAELKTKNNSGMVVVLALNYGSRQEILDAAVRFAGDVRQGKVLPESLSEDMFSGYLYTAGMPDPDLFIRTSGELRISNFLLWQLSYAELYFSGKFWPDFSAADLEMAIEEFQRRERRFGALPQQ